jgi:hypothetical protein
MSGHNSVVEYKLPKLGVASSNLVARSMKGRLFIVKRLLSADSGNGGLVAERRFWQYGCDLDLIFLSWIIK